MSSTTMNTSRTSDCFERITRDMYAMNNFQQRPAAYGSGDIGTGEYQYPTYMNQQICHGQYDMMHRLPSFCINSNSGHAMCVHNITEENRSTENTLQALQNTFNNVSLAAAKHSQSTTRILNRCASWIDASCATLKCQKLKNPKRKRCTRSIYHKAKHQCHYRAWKRHYWHLLNKSIKYKELKKASKDWESSHTIEAKSMLLKNHVYQYNNVYEKLRHLLIEYSKRIEEVQRFPGDVRKFEKHWSCLSRTLKEQKVSIANLEHALSTKTEAFDHISACLERSEATSAYRKTAISNLKNEISELTAQKTKLEEELKEAQSTNKKLTVHCKHLASQIELVEEKLKALKDINRKLDENFKAQMVCYELEKTSCHEECKSKTHESLVKMSSVYQKHLAELGSKQTFADAKIKELYLTIENIVKGIYRIMSEKEKGSEDKEDSNRSCSNIDMLPKLVEWLQICNNMVYKPTFAEELSSFVLTLYNMSVNNTGLKEP
ncbi:uncharacterized protein LOC106667050 isoform X3 [Cimex lectularius]|uniref:Uncharacterized protein n=2 Tax=Cimex lectularius TaxID=79782 RepID=A0A8I6RRP7_CIMLE|nr:uncharacterized protein LOC106667050 isoform X3 [Cimex lectularius]